jgi:hypothetical protein
MAEAFITVIFAAAVIWWAFLVLAPSFSRERGYEPIRIRSDRRKRQ